MSYYVMLSNDISGIFGPAATKQSVIAMLRKLGKSDVSEFGEIAGLQQKKRSGPAKWTFTGNFALLLGTEKKSSDEFVEALDEFFGLVDEITLEQPKPKEWLAAVTFVDPDNAPTFQVVALVGSSALQAAKVNWAHEDKPPKFWVPYVSDFAGGAKKIFDLKRFNGLGKW